MKRVLAFLLSSLALAGISMGQASLMPGLTYNISTKVTFPPVNGVTLLETTTPSAPASGKRILWVDSSGAIHLRGNAGDISIGGTTGTSTAILKGNGSGGFSDATSGTDYVTPQTTLSGYGITDAQPLDSDLTAIAALSTASAGRSLLTLSAVPTGALVGTSDSQALTGKTYNGLTISTSTGTLTIANSKTATISNTLTFTGTDGSTLNIGSGGTLGSNAYTSTTYVPATRTVNGHALSADVTVTKSDLGLSSVENTALSTWTGSTNLVTLGTGAITGLTEDTTPSTANDFVMTYDASATQLKKVKLANLGTGGGGGGSINVDSEAWVSNTLGDDGTGTLGDPGKPFLTAQAAYDAGGRILHLGSGASYSIDIISALDDVYLAIIGPGKDLATFTVAGGVAPLNLYDLGGYSVNTSVYMNNVPAPGTFRGYNLWLDTVASAGEAGGAGASGGRGGDVYLYRCHVASTLEMWGGAGGTGTEVDGGAGGNAGVLTAYYTTINPNVSAYGGTGGASDTGTGGNGGNGQTHYLYHCSLGGNLYAYGGTGGVGGLADGNGGNASSLTAEHSSVPAANLAPGTGASGGSEGTVTGYFISIPVVSAGTPSISAHGYYINGTGGW